MGVVGAGPAGAAAALGLTALGYGVCVVAGPARAPARRESFSARALEALRGLRLESALRSVGPPGRRVVRWAGAARELPGEAQAERAAFDAGLLEDLARLGVAVLRDEATRAASADDAAQVALASGAALEARFLVDARGRSAPGGEARTRGPETLCLVQRWQRGASGAARGPEIAIASLAEGWAWLADDGRGELAVQLAVDAADAPSRAELAARVADALDADASCRAWLAGAAPAGDVHARGATAVLGGALAGARALRIGDAALAVDPLSGNGVFQALATALVAPAVVNTLLRAPERAALARRFAGERARDLFARFARVSRDFHALGAAHHGGAYWRARAAWPDAAGDPGPALAIARRPVVRDGWIEEREVVVTPERPLGTWQLAGVELAPLVRALATAEPADSARALAALPHAARGPVHAWLRAHQTDGRLRLSAPSEAG
jgi:flavin-dependent dehydrogenase